MEEVLGAVGPPGPPGPPDDRGPLRKGKFNQESFQPRCRALLLEGVTVEVTTSRYLLDPFVWASGGGLERHKRCFNLKIHLRADPDRIEYRILLREIRLFVTILLAGLRPL